MTAPLDTVLALHTVAQMFYWARFTDEGKNALFAFAGRDPRMENTAPWDVDITLDAELKTVDIVFEKYHRQTRVDGWSLVMPYAEFAAIYTESKEKEAKS